jgi:hypothetical protein
LPFGPSLGGGTGIATGVPGVETAPSERAVDQELPVIAILLRFGYSIVQKKGRQKTTQVVYYSSILWSWIRIPANCPGPFLSSWSLFYPEGLGRITFLT